MLKLNSRQREAVRYIDGPLLVLAGAGSGKTRVITQKIAYLIEQCNIQANKIAAVTFTNKAAKEMKARVSGVLDKKQTKGLKVSTFHTLGLNILRKEGYHLGYKKQLSIYDAQDSQTLLKQLAPKNMLKEIAVEKVQQQISLWKNALVTPDTALTTDHENPHGHSIAKIYAEYARYMKAYNALDFDDLIRLPVKLFMENREVLDKWQNRIQYLLVDEYQDTNATQYAMVKLLVGARGALTVVGDDDQSVYAWRGANPENMAQLQIDFANLKLIKLEQNYRSTTCILKAANGLIDNNPHVFTKKLWSDTGFGELINVVDARDEEHEAERVVSNLLNHKFQNRTECGDYAILYRGNFQSRLFERCLREHQIPYYLTGGTSFFSYTEVKDIMAYLRLLANDDDDQAFLRVINTPRREIGPSTLEKLAIYATQRDVSLCEASYELGLETVLPERQIKRLRRFVEWLALMSDRAKRGDIMQAIRDLIDDISYKTWLEDICRDQASAERKMENVTELVSWINRLVDKADHENEVSLSELIQQMTVMDILDREDNTDTPNSVNLMTLHSAKGLEFPHVYIVGMEENLLPHYVSLEEDNIEEERRLAYVGITRAQKTLTFSCAAKRKRGGEMIECEPSRFLAELPEDTIVWNKLQHQNPEQRQQLGRAHLNNLRGLLGDSSDKKQLPVNEN
ncbi:MAG: DNA helicase Rep [Gammaproteobacteria bacterium]|nr:DNA helicase Rep [Gammaproteobacteria bacterium]